MADYYVVESDDKQWQGRMRITTGGLNAALVDALDVLANLPNEFEVLDLLLAEARAAASQLDRIAGSRHSGFGEALGSRWLQAGRATRVNPGRIELTVWAK